MDSMDSTKHRLAKHNNGNSTMGKAMKLQSNLLLNVVLPKSNNTMGNAMKLQTNLLLNAVLPKSNNTMGNAMKLQTNLLLNAVLPKSNNTMGKAMKFQTNLLGNVVLPKSNNTMGRAMLQKQWVGYQEKQYDGQGYEAANQSAWQWVGSQEKQYDGQGYEAANQSAWQGVAPQEKQYDGQGYEASHQQHSEQGGSWTWWEKDALGQNLWWKWTSEGGWSRFKEKSTVEGDGKDVHYGGWLCKMTALLYMYDKQDITRMKSALKRLSSHHAIQDPWMKLHKEFMKYGEDAYKRWL